MSQCVKKWSYFGAHNNGDVRITKFGLVAQSLMTQPIKRFKSVGSILCRVCVSQSRNTFHYPQSENATADVQRRWRCWLPPVWGRDSRTFVFVHSIA